MNRLRADQILGFWSRARKRIRNGVRADYHHTTSEVDDGSLSEDEGVAGSRTYMNLGTGLNRPRASETDPPSFLHWTTPTLTRDLEVIGPIELQLDASCTAPDTAFIAVLQDVDENGNVIHVTAGYLRPGLRRVDEAASKCRAPVLPCRTFEPVPLDDKVR